MAKFKFIYWLVEFVLSTENFIFDWDGGNSTKSKDKHGITVDIVESAFSDENLLALGEQFQPIVNESRYGVIAKSIDSNILFICFTIRDKKIRVISTRLANEKERSFYEE